MELLAIKGVGAYAANALLMLLGHYDGLPIDSAFRSHVKNKYFAGKEVSDLEMAAVYEPWSAWKALAYWFDAEE
jgi:3-methyladenine DNA glycosylase/8-oxoguanine DNA glycosylase